jgi:hypothetical protein
MKNHTIASGFVRTPTPRYDVVIRTTSHAVCVKVRAFATIVFSDHFGNELCERIGMSFNDPPPDPSI